MLVRKIRNLKGKGLVLMVFIPGFVFVLLMSGLNFYFRIGLKASLGDCLMLVSGRKFNLLLAATVFLTAYIFKEENKIILLRHKSRREIYRNNFLSMLMCTFVLLVYFYFCTLLIGSFFSSSFLNWNSDAGIYFMTTEHINQSVSFLSVLLISICYNFLSLAAWNAVFTAFYSVTGNYIYGALFLVAAVTLGQQVLGRYDFGVRMFVDYYVFDSMKHIGSSVLFFLFIGICSFGLGYVNAERKDYLG